MEIQFSHEDQPGRVLISCGTTDDPARIGAHEAAIGLPHLTAHVEYPGRGYRALFGWVQLVRSTDNESGGRSFELDPFALFPDTPSPYCFFGFEPTLFDAPARDTRAPTEWLAHSFLAYSPLRGSGRQVIPLLGFSWGFDIDDQAEVRVKPIEQLQSEDWSRQTPLLEASHSSWAFESGFR